jgi:RHS repeat-associated protein
VGPGYDANGNMTWMPGGPSLSYDFLNRVVQYGAAACYAYDASNRRIWKGTLGSGGQIQTQEYILYGLDGENLGTYTPGGTAPWMLSQAQARVYFFGKKLFMTEDTVGSAASGGTFYPYGEQKSGTTMTEQYAFATYWRDSESGLDYAMGRYYSSGLGRFLSPDPYGHAKLAVPQSFDQYAYVVGDPVNSNDPTGLCAVLIGGITMSQSGSPAMSNEASTLGAIQAYPYAGLNALRSVENVLGQATEPDDSTQVALNAILYALSTNSGSIDIIAYSGGAAAFTAAWGELSPAQQQRIGNILYISPGAVGGLVVNPGATSIVMGTGTTDSAATLMTSFPPGVPVTYTNCSHTDLACLLLAAQEEGLSAIQAGGQCSQTSTFQLTPSWWETIPTLSSLPTPQVHGSEFALGDLGDVEWQTTTTIWFPPE